MVPDADVGELVTVRNDGDPYTVAGSDFDDDIAKARDVAVEILLSSKIGEFTVRVDRPNFGSTIDDIQVGDRDEDGTPI